MAYSVTAFYKFVELSDLETLREHLLQLGQKHQICGSILIAAEGINSTIGARQPGLDDFMSALREIPAFSDLNEKRSTSDKVPFFRFKVRIKKEIVTLGVDGVDPVNECGEYVEPADWNDLIDDPDVILVDTRNDYEYAIGKFEGSVDPKTKAFRQFPQWVDQNLDPEKNTKVAMYCTGGIRCEKATALLRKKGFKQVFHLKGGILKYLEEIPAEQSKWQGSCFVFDNRVGLEHGLDQSELVNCPGCRHPLTSEDRQHPLFEEGVVCHRCAETADEKNKAGRRERHRQILLARQRGERHMGSFKG